MFLMRGRIGQAVICFILVGCLFASFIGVSHIGMGQEMNGQTMGCPFMPGVVICNMTPVQHIAAAQSMFNASVQTDFSTFILLILSLLIAAALSKLRPLPRLRFVQAIVLPRIQIFASPLFALQEAYARGILNPKLF